MSNRIPFSSITAGLMDDGALEGQINETVFNRVIANSRLATNRYALRMDADVGQFTDIKTTLDAISNTNIFGATANMSNGDGALIACDDATKDIIVNIVTPGVGTWKIEIWDSTNGTTFNRQITGFADRTNNFKAPAGWADIVLPELVNNENIINTRAAITPSPLLPGEAGTSRKWVLIKVVPDGSFSVTTAPIINQMKVLHPSNLEKWIDITAEVNGSLSVSPNNTLQFFPFIGSKVIYFTDGLPTGYERYVWDEQGNAQTRKITYATAESGATFADLTGVVDPSNDFTVDPGVTGLPKKYSVRWNVPANAAKVTASYTLTNKSLISVSNKYAFAIETTAVSTVAPQNPNNSRVRSKELGATGTTGTVVTPQTIKRVSITRHGSASGSGNVSFQLYNFTQQTSVTIVFPDTDNNETQNYDISDMNFADGDKRGLYHMAGARILNDLSIEYHY